MSDTPPLERTRRRPRRGSCTAPRASIPAARKISETSGARRTLTPTTAAPSAAGFEPARPVSCHATFAATSEDEHAVSNATEGPRRSKIKTRDPARRTRTTPSPRATTTRPAARADGSHEIVVSTRDTRVDTPSTPREGSRDASRGERERDDGVEEESLLRIARRSFRGGDTEELAVEHIRRVDECGERGRDVSRFANPRGLHVPTRAGHARAGVRGW